MKYNKDSNVLKTSMEGQEQYYLRPMKLGCWKRFTTCLWNSQTGQCFGRTASSWAKILLFYFCFYLVLAALTMAVFTVFWQTLDMKVPKWQLDSSLIGSNPGLGFRPMPSDSSSLIWVKQSDPRSLKVWIDKLEEFLDPYQKMNIGDNVVSCSSTSPPEEGQVCFVDLNDFLPCTIANNFGYSSGTPCVFLKLNKIFNWKPNFFSPQNLPADLMNQMTFSGTSEDSVWVSCAGVNPSDLKHVKMVKYLPRQGFPVNFYPYKNQDSYLSPLVAVQFLDLTPGVVVSIECKAWAKNIKHDRALRQGSVQFQLMIEP